VESQFFSILIGVIFVVGLPLLEKFIDKAKQGSQRSTPAAPQAQPQRRTRPPRAPRVQSQQRRPEPPPRPAETPLLEVEEGARVTADTPAIQYPVQEPTPPISRDELRKAVIWSEVLNHPKFKDF